MVNVDAVWLYDDLNSCCEQFFSYKLAYCKTGGGTVAYTGTDKWYASWDDATCFKDCAVEGTDCGGPADYYQTNNLFDSKAKCCKTNFNYDYKNCLK